MAAGLLAASLSLPVPVSALQTFGASVSNRPAATARTIKARQAVPVSRRELARHQRQERRQLNLLFRRLNLLLRAHQLLERRLRVSSPFQVVISFPFSA